MSDVQNIQSADHLLTILENEWKKSMEGALEIVRQLIRLRRDEFNSRQDMGMDAQECSKALSYLYAEESRLKALVEFWKGEGNA